MAHKRLTASGKLALPDGDSHDAQAKITGIQLVAGSNAANVIGYKAHAATDGKQFMELTAAADTEESWTPGNSGALASPGGWYFAISGTGPQVHIFYE